MSNWAEEQPVGWAAGFAAGRDEDHGEHTMILARRGCKEYDRKKIPYDRRKTAAWFYGYRAGRREISDINPQMVKTIQAAAAAYANFKALIGNPRAAEEHMQLQANLLKALTP